MTWTLINLFKQTHIPTQWHSQYCGARLEINTFIAQSKLVNAPLIIFQEIGDIVEQICMNWSTVWASPTLPVRFALGILYATGWWNWEREKRYALRAQFVGIWFSRGNWPLYRIGPQEVHICVIVLMVMVMVIVRDAPLDFQGGSRKFG